jgi:hypothetical protein
MSSVAAAVARRLQLEAAITVVQRVVAQSFQPKLIVDKAEFNFAFTQKQC